MISITSYIPEIFDPYFADGKNNDANILNSIIKERYYFIRSALVRRCYGHKSFQNLLETLKEYDLIPKMPHFLRERKQHFVEDANESKLVTKIWVVELVNDPIKSQKTLVQIFPNSQISYIVGYVHIVSVLCNVYRTSRSTRSISTQVALSDDEIIAQQMLVLVQ